MSPILKTTKERILILMDEEFGYSDMDCLDSLDIVDLIHILENEFDIDIEGDLPRDMDSVVKLVESKM